MGIKGYKVFNPDWTCKGFRYEVGKIFKYDGNIKICSGGFHFCQKARDCFSYYKFDSKNKVAEVEALGIVKTKSDKSVTDEILIVRELSWHEVLDMVNNGSDCTGIDNTGDWNAGNGNTGDCNTGNGNTGDCNTGNWNAGNGNTGDCNTGDRNAGDCNTGDCNTGYCNTGDWNKTNFSSGFFNTKEVPVIAFNRVCNVSRYEFIYSKGFQVLNSNFKNNWWICSEYMSEEEKMAHPEHETMGGYLKTVDFQTACRLMWESLNNDDKQAVREIPNFDAEVFMEITDIDLRF